MRVILHDVIFADASASPDHLDELLVMGLRGRHHFVTRGLTPALDRLLAARDWTERWRAACERSARAVSSQRIEHTVEVVPPAEVDPARATPRIDVPAAVHLLRQPLHIMLENGRNDSKFLRALATLDGRLPALDTLLHDGHIACENGGGLPEMAQQLGEHLRDRLQRLRRFVIFDSDALAPGMPGPAAALKKKCQPQLTQPPRVGHHRLLRRAAENYLPPPCLTAWTASPRHPHKGRVRAWTKLNSDQRHHFAMRDGLMKDVGQATAEALFRDLADGPRSILQQGFGREVRDLFDATNPNWERWMREDGQADEVRALFHELLARV